MNKHKTTGIEASLPWEDPKPTAPFPPTMDLNTVIGWDGVPTCFPVSKTVSIEAHSRASIKVGDSFYTFEFVEKREISVLGKPITEMALAEERQNLWDTVHQEVDTQIEELLESQKR